MNLLHQSCDVGEALVGRNHWKLASECLHYDTYTLHTDSQINPIMWPSSIISLSLLQQTVDLSSEGSATWVLQLCLALFSMSTNSSRKSSMLYLTMPIHLFLCLPLLRCPRTSASKILLTQPLLDVVYAQNISVWPPVPCPRMRRMSSFLILSHKVRPRIHHDILTLLHTFSMFMPLSHRSILGLTAVLYTFTLTALPIYLYISQGLLTWKQKFAYNAKLLWKFSTAGATNVLPVLFTLRNVRSSLPDVKKSTYNDTHLTQTNLRVIFLCKFKIN